MEKLKRYGPCLNQYGYATMQKIDNGGWVKLSDIKTVSTPADPWAHRSQGMRCASCMWYVAKASNSVQCDDHIVGRCRKHAPSMSGYPVVFSDDWCGDHKLNELAAQ